MKKGLLNKICKYAFAIGLSLSFYGCVTAFVNALGKDKSVPYKGQIESVRYSRQAVQDSAIDLMTFNIAHCRGPHPPAKGDLAKNLTIRSEQQIHECTDTLAEVIRQEDPDVVCLNEVDWHADWSFGVNQVKEIAEKAGYKFYSFGTKWDHLWPCLYIREGGVTFPFIHTHVGNAILSKHPIISSENKSFDGEDAWDWMIGEHKYLHSTIDINGAKISHICTHLDSDSVENRIQEAGVLVAEAKKSKLPLIISGDFNSVLPSAKKARPRLGKKYKNDTSMDILVDSGLYNIFMERADPNDLRFYTANSDKLTKTIDFIMYSKSKDYNFRILDYYVFCGFSDHCAVRTKAVLKMK